MVKLALLIEEEEVEKNETLKDYLEELSQKYGTNINSDNCQFRLNDSIDWIYIKEDTVFQRIKNKITNIKITKKRKNENQIRENTINEMVNYLVGKVNYLIDTVPTALTSINNHISSHNNQLFEIGEEIAKISNSIKHADNSLRISTSSFSISNSSIMPAVIENRISNLDSFNINSISLSRFIPKITFRCSELVKEETIRNHKPIFVYFKL